MKTDKSKQLARRWTMESRLLTPRNEKTYDYTKFSDLNNKNAILVEFGEVEVRLKDYREKLQGIHKQFKNYKQQRVNAGFNVPKEMDSILQQENDEFKAWKEVAEQELKLLKGLLEKVETKKEAEASPVRPSREWGAGRLRGGILCEQGGFTVTPDEEGLLRIDDTRSKHNGMPIWQFRAQIVKPMHEEWGQRVKVATEKARKDGTMAGRIPYPPAPIWRKESGTLEYPGYSEQALARIKKNKNG